MPPKKQTTRQPPRRSGRRTVIEDDEPLEEAGTAKSYDATALELEEDTTQAVDHDKYIDVDDDNDDEDVIMQEPDTGAATTGPSSSPLRSTARQPVQRLASVLSPSSSTSISHPQASNSSLPATSQQPRQSALKFKPKAIVRRSKEEREAFEKAERERLAARHDSNRDSLGRGDGGGQGKGRGGHEGREKRGRGRAFSHGYGYGSGGNRGGATSLRRERLDPRAASGPLGGAAVISTHKRGKRTATGVEEVSDEDGKDSGDEVVETSGTVTKGKRKARERVKKEAGVKPEGGDKDVDGTIGAEVDRTGKRKRDLLGIGSGKGKGKGRAKVKKEDEAPTYVSSEGEFDSDAAEKINIEAINLVSSEDEEVEEDPTGFSVQSETAKAKQSEKENRNAAEAKKIKNWMNRPVHVERLEHIERAVGVNTEASSLSSADLRRKAKERKEGEAGLFLDEAEPELNSGMRRGRRKPKDVEFVRDKRKWKGVYVDEDDEEGRIGGGARVKSEPREDEATADTQLVLENDDEVPGAEIMEIDHTDVDSALQETTAAAGARDGSEGARALDKEADTHEGALADEEDTDDEELDLEMISENEEMDDIQLETMASSPEEDQSYYLSNCQPKWKNFLEQYAKSKTAEPATTSNLKSPNESTFKGNSEETRAARHHETYLVQLPPVIPSLRNIITKPTAIKREKRPTPESLGASTNHPSNTSHPGGVTKEESSPPPLASIDHQKIPNAIHQPAHARDFAGGVAGTLTFYGNGKTLASWGDLSFEVTKEREAVGLAQETMIMDYEKVVTKIEDHGRWDDVITVGGRKEREGGKVGYSGGRVGGGFSMLGA